MTTDDDEASRAIRGDATPIIANKRPLSPEQTSIFHHNRFCDRYFLHGAMGKIKMKGCTMVILWEDRASRDDEDVDLDHPPLF